MDEIIDRIRPPRIRNTALMLRPRLQPIGEADKLKLAKWLLLGTAILFLCGGAAQLIYSENGANIFEACKTILPPIATLIIGYYFSEKSRQ